MKLIDLVKGTKVQFDSYRKGVFYYTVETADKKFLFSVPLDDIGDATLLKEDKATLFQRWIRKALEAGELIEIKKEIEIKIKKETILQKVFRFIKKYFK